jgi:hypothetical protein
MLLGILGGGAYLAIISVFPNVFKKPKAKIVPTPSAPISGSTATASGYSEEWIPEVHLKSRKTKVSGALSSGDESGPEKKTKGKKRS